MKCQIKFVQGASTPPAGQALLGALTTNVVATNGGDDTDVQRRIFEWIDTGSGTSAIATGVAQDGASSSLTFSPDARGGYLLHMTIVDSQGNTDEDWRVFQVAETSGRIIPPFGAEDWMMNFGGQVFGYSRYLNDYLRHFDSLTLRNEQTITTTTTIADRTTDLQAFLNFAAPGNVTLPTPVAGLEIALTDISGSANTNNVTILPHAAETINGAASLVLNTNRGSFVLRSDGTNWAIVSRGATPVTGTGFLHNTSGSVDPAARAVNLATADITGILPLANEASPTGSGFARVSGGSWVGAASALSASDIPNPAGDVAGTYAATIVQQLSGGFGSHTGFVSVPSPAFIGFGAFATMATTGSIRFGDMATGSAANLIMGRNHANTTDQTIVEVDGLGNVFYGDFSWTVAEMLGGTASSLNTASGSVQYNSGRFLFFAAGGIVTQSVTGLFVFNNPFDSLLTGWKFQLASVDILNIGQNADGINSLISSGTYQGPTRSVSSAYTVDASGPDETILVDTSAGTVAVTLPTPRNGRRIWFKDKKGTWATNNFSLLRHGTEKIDGVAATLVRSASGGNFVIVSDGTDWYLWN